MGNIPLFPSAKVRTLLHTCNKKNMFYNIRKQKKKLKKIAIFPSIRNPGNRQATPRERVNIRRGGGRNGRAGNRTAVENAAG